MKPVVTIGICVKNEEANVGGAVESVLDQDFPHELMEVIVVDGYSKDRTVKIIEGFLSKGDIEYRIFLENEGLGHARQMVVENAEGDYIIWVDGDIRLSRDYVTKQVEFMEKNPKAGIAGGKYRLYTGKKLVSLLENMSYVIRSFKDEGRLTKLKGTEASIFRVRAVKEQGGFDIHIRGAAEDTDVAHRIREAGWSLIYATDAQFYEKCRESWKALWNQYFWYGYGQHFVVHKNKELSELVYKSTPFAGFLEGVLSSSTAYKVTGRKLSFLLPIYFSAKRLAWCAGFIKSHMDSYGHM